MRSPADFCGGSDARPARTRLRPVPSPKYYGTIPRFVFRAPVKTSYLSDISRGRNSVIIVIAASRLRMKVDIMNAATNPTSQLDNPHESTYALLIRSEEKSRNIFEAVIHPLLVLGPLIAIWQFAQQPVNIPAAGLKPWVVFDAPAQNNVCRDEFQSRRGDLHPDIQG